MNIRCFCLAEREMERRRSFSSLVDRCLYFYRAIRNGTKYARTVCLARQENKHKKDEPRSREKSGKNWMKNARKNVLNWRERERENALQSKKQRGIASECKWNRPTDDDNNINFLFYGFSLCLLLKLNMNLMNLILAEPMRRFVHFSLCHLVVFTCLLRRWKFFSSPNTHFHIYS